MDRAEHDRQVDHEQHSCRHFTGIQHDECATGVNYRALVGGEQFGWVRRIPCVPEPGETVPCEKLSLPSREEAEAIVTEMDEATAAVIRHIATGEPLPEGVTYIACRREDMGPSGDGE
jgi:hypothetical protein